MAHLRDGREHHLYQVRLSEGIRLLKFPRVDALADPYDPHRTAEERLLAEATAIYMIRDVPVPSPYLLYPSSPMCALMGQMVGTTPEIDIERGRLDATLLHTICVQMGRALARIHACRRPADPPLPDLEPVRDSRLLHLDFHLGNVLGTPRASGHWELTGVVDWTCARFGPVEADFAEMQISVFILNPRMRDAFIGGYRQLAPVPIDLDDIERRAAALIRQRLALDPPMSEWQRDVWSQWAKGR